MSVSRRDPVNPSTLPFPISILQKQRQNYLLFGKSLKNDCNNLYFNPYTFDMSYKSLSYLTSLYRGRQVNPSAPTLGNINLTVTMIKLTCCLEIQSKTAVITSICTLNPLSLCSYCGFNWVLSGF